MSNLVLRILAAIFGIPLLLYSATAGGMVLYILVFLIQAALLYEWRKLSAANQAKLNWFFILTIAVSLDAAMVTYDSRIWGITLLLIPIMLTYEIFAEPKRPHKNLGSGALFILYALLPLSLWFVINDLDIQNRFGNLSALALLMIAIWISDSAAYFCGRLFGKHKLYESVSPKKTVEGAIGGLVFPALILPIMSFFDLASPTITDYIVLPVIVGVFGQIGDLLESMLKREVDVKDSSSLIPGHGGFLDRFDSLLIATPMFYAYLLITN